jgi:O-antigen/teichoic acid export membrane protein
LDAAIQIYHCVVFIFSLQIIIIPYQAMINAKEDMHVIALHGILDSLFKLVSAYLIILISYDKLKSFGLFLLLFTILTSVFLYVICGIKYKECKVSLKKQNNKLYKDIFSFAGWTVFGSLSSLIKNQGSTILLNIFLGPAVNAAFGIANQIANQIRILAITLLKAVNPQIVMSYGKKNLKEMFDYFITTSKFSFYLVLLFIVPLFLEMNFILNTWLNNVPDFTIVFSKIIIINVLIDVLIGPMITVIQATGKIKYYQIVSGLTFLLNIPVIYLLLYFNFRPVSVIISNIIFTFFVGIIRLLYLKYLLNLSIIGWIKNVLFKGLIILCVSVVTSFSIYYLMNSGWDRLWTITILNFIICSVAIMLFGINKSEKYLIKKSFQEFLKTN